MISLSLVIEYQPTAICLTSIKSFDIASDTIINYALKLLQLDLKCTSKLIGDRMFHLESVLARTGGVRLETAAAKTIKLASLRIVWFLLQTKHAMRNAVKLLEEV